MDSGSIVDVVVVVEFVVVGYQGYQGLTLNVGNVDAKQPSTICNCIYNFNLGEFIVDIRAILIKYFKNYFKNYVTSFTFVNKLFVCYSNHSQSPDLYSS